MVKLNTWMLAQARERKQAENSHIAIAIGVKNPSVAMTIEQLSAYFIATSSHYHYKIQVYWFDKPSGIHDFQANCEKNLVHGVIALDYVASRALVHAVHHAGLTIPGVLLSYRELLPAAIAPNLCVISPPTTADSLSRFFSMLIQPGFTFLMVCPVLLIEKAPLLSSFITLERKRGVEVILVDTELPAAARADAIIRASGNASFIFLAQHDLVLPHIAEIFSVAQSIELPVIGAHLSALDQGAAIVFGQLEHNTLRLAANKLFAMMEFFDGIPSLVTAIPFEMYCNITQLNKYPSLLSTVRTIMGESKEFSVHFLARQLTHCPVSEEPFMALQR